MVLAKNTLFFFFEMANGLEAIFQDNPTYFKKSTRDQVTIKYLLGESFCQNPMETLEDVRPNPFSVEGSMNSPSPGFVITSLFLCSPASTGEEWADTEVLAISESLGKLSVSFRGCRPMVKDRTVPGTPLGSVVATRTLSL